MNTLQQIRSRYSLGLSLTPDRCRNNAALWRVRRSVLARRRSALKTLRREVASKLASIDREMVVTADALDECNEEIGWLT